MGLSVNVTRISSELLQITTDEVTNYTYNWTEKQLEMIRIRERIRTEFYNTYDPMTGIRIALTLSGFFIIMVLMIFLKGRSEADLLLKTKPSNSNCNNNNNKSTRAQIDSLRSNDMEMSILNDFNSQTKSYSSSSSIYDDYEESFYDNSINSIINLNLDYEQSIELESKLSHRCQNSSSQVRLAPLASISSCETIFLVIDDK